MDCICTTANQNAKAFATLIGHDYTREKKLFITDTTFLLRMISRELGAIAVTVFAGRPPSSLSSWTHSRRP